MVQRRQNRIVVLLTEIEHTFRSKEREKKILFLTQGVLYDHRTSTDTWQEAGMHLLGKEVIGEEMIQDTNL